MFFSPAASLAPLLFSKSDVNPYQPTGSLSAKAAPVPERERFVVPPRLNLLTAATLLTSFLSAIAIYLYHSRGLSGIGDPILAKLAAHSSFWIPVYRLATPALVLVMPKSCRRSFGTCFLMIGVLCCANDYPFYFAGKALVVDSFGLYPPFAACIATSVLVFIVELVRSQNRIRSIRDVLGWISVVLGVHGLFFLIGQSL